LDKLALLPLIAEDRSSSIKTIFEQEETDTLQELVVRWGFSSLMLDRFFKPFLEGIYLAPLEEQSSRMFHFVFKMFAEGSATLPAGGMQKVADQLSERAQSGGNVEIRTSQPVASISRKQDENDGYSISLSGGQTLFASCVIVATDGTIAQRLVSQLEGFEFLQSLPLQTQRQVGCLYYTFKGPPPVTDPILILNGMEERGTPEQPANNVCFPSVVAEGYAPAGCNVCSVTVLKNALDAYNGRDAELDAAVRKQLSTWFPEAASDILSQWQLRRIYRIDNAQPAQLNGPAPASIHGGRLCSMYRGKKLPPRFFVCGDHMATATLNGALESGENAGQAAAVALATVSA
jgi:phytoene dehydrogenase-like protein